MEEPIEDSPVGEEKMANELPEMLTGTIGSGLRRSLTRQRYLELARIAEDLCVWIESKGVTRNEQCVLDGLVHTMIPLKGE